MRKNCSCPQCTEARDYGIRYPHRNSSSILVEVRDQDSPKESLAYSRMLIDMGGDIRKGIAEVEPQCVLLTSAHPDHAVGIIGVDPTIPVIFTHRTFVAIKSYLRTGRRFYLIRQGEQFRFNRLKVVAHAVYCSWIHPAVCYKIDDKVIYAPDCLGFKDEGILDGVETYICDGSTLYKDIVRSFMKSSRVGHMSVESSLALARKHGVKRVVVTHIGHLRLSCLEMQRAVNEMGAELAFDGFNIENLAREE